MIVLDQLTNDLERFRRAVAIIPGQKRDLAPVDATAFVDSLEVGALNAAQYRIAGSWAAKGRVLLAATETVWGPPFGLQEVSARV